MDTKSIIFVLDAGGTGFTENKFTKKIAKNPI